MHTPRRHPMPVGALPSISDFDSANVSLRIPTSQLGLKPVNAATAAPVNATGDSGLIGVIRHAASWAGGDSDTITPDFHFLHAHGLGFVNDKRFCSKCFPGAGPCETGAHIAYEARISFDVKNPPDDPDLYVGQHIVTKSKWVRNNRQPVYIVDTWNESMPLYGGRTSPPDEHIDQMKFPEYCAAKVVVKADLWVIKLKEDTYDRASEGLPPTWRSSYHFENADGEPTSPETANPNFPTARLMGDFRSDPNVSRVGRYRGKYKYEIDIDHCHLVPLYHQVVKSMKSAGLDTTDLDLVWQWFTIYRLLSTMGLAGRALSGTAGLPGLQLPDALASGVPEGPVGLQLENLQEAMANLQWPESANSGQPLQVPE